MYENKRWRKHVLKRFGLDHDPVKQPGACCEVCSTTTDLHLDHDHATGEYRGLLCGNHNRALGLLSDDPDTIAALLGYMTRRLFAAAA